MTVFPERRSAVPAAVWPGGDGDPLALHRRLPGYAPTPLVALPVVAAELGIGEVWAKDESSRLELPAFKLLGGSWAVYRVLAARSKIPLEPWSTLSELRERIAPLGPLTLVAATDGNHGRGIARMAALLGLDADIYLPAGSARARVDAIRDEGASVTVLDGSYDETVRVAAASADDRRLVVSDTSWPGYTQVPAWVVDGYSTMFRELDEQWATAGGRGPDLVMVQAGVGALAGAAVLHYGAQKPRPRIVTVEPTDAACISQSLQAGQLVEAPAPHKSIMAGLNCGLPSELVWPLLRDGIDAAVTVTDEQARDAMRTFARAGLQIGETGAAGMAGLFELLRSPAPETRDRLGLTATSTALVLCTEGITDPEEYGRIMGAGG